MKEKDVNLRRIVQYAESGIKASGTGALGIELEHFVVDRRSFLPVSYDDGFGQRKILAEFFDVIGSEAHAEPVFEEDDLIGLECQDYSISLEPAGQFEISLKAEDDISRIIRIYRAFRDVIDPILSRRDLALVTLGYAPRGSVRDMRMIPKRRYRRMSEHFRKTGDSGELMMKGTASLQVSIDYFGEDDFAKRYEVGMKLMPFLKLLASNSPFFEGARNRDPLVRTRIWDGVDKKRCSYPERSFGEGFSFADYAAHALDQEMIFYPFDEDRDGPLRSGKMLTAREFFSEKAMDERDVEYVLSMVFPEIRLKKVLELRGMDSMRLESAAPVLALLKGVFCVRGGALDDIDGMFSLSKEWVERTNLELSANGWKGIVGGREAREIARDIADIASQALSPEDRRLVSVIGEGAF